MWVNFQEDHSNGNRGDGQRLSRLQLPPEGRRKTKGIKRQNSTQSTKSTKSGSQSNLRKAIEEHYFKTQTADWQKQEEYRCRRNRRKVREERLAQRLKTVRRFYILAVLLILSGIILLFCSTIRSVGEGTFVWNFREQFHIIAPTVLVLGVVLLLVIAGLESKLSEETDKTTVDEVFLHEDFKTERENLSRQTSQENPSLNRGRSKYSLEDSQNREFFYTNRDHDGGTSPDLSDSFNLTSHWANAMRVSLSSGGTDSNETSQPHRTERCVENGIGKPTRTDITTVHIPEEEDTSVIFCYKVGGRTVHKTSAITAEDTSRQKY